MLYNLTLSQLQDLSVASVHKLSFEVINLSSDEKTSDICVYFCYHFGEIDIH